MGAITLVGCGEAYIANNTIVGTNVGLELVDTASVTVENLAALETNTAIKARKVGKLSTDNVVHSEKGRPILSLQDSIRRAIYGYV